MRKRVNLSFSPAEWEQVQNGAGTMPVTAWCKDRVLLSEGFGDPLLDCVSEALLATAGLRMHRQLWVDTMMLGYQLSAAISGRPLEERGNASVRTLIADLKVLVGNVLADQETILEQQVDLMQKVTDLSRAVNASQARPRGSRAKPKP